MTTRNLSSQFIASRSAFHKSRPDFSHQSSHIEDIGPTVHDGIYIAINEIRATFTDNCQLIKHAAQTLSKIYVPFFKFNSEAVSDEQILVDQIQSKSAECRQAVADLSNISKKVTGVHCTVINNIIIGLKLEYTSACEFVKEAESCKRRIVGTPCQDEQIKSINNHTNDYEHELSSCQSQSQIRQNLLTDDQLRDREMQIVQVAKSVHEVHSIMGELNMMVVTQGTILDTIGHNIEIAATKVKSGTKDLSKADAHQKKASSASNKILGGLAAAVAILGISLGIKKS
jgi:hypothetical protein